MVSSCRAYVKMRSTLLLGRTWVYRHMSREHTPPCGTSSLCIGGDGMAKLSGDRELGSAMLAVRTAHPLSLAETTTTSGWELCARQRSITQMAHARLSSEPRTADVR